TATGTGIGADRICTQAVVANQSLVMSWVHATTRMNSLGQREPTCKKSCPGESHSANHEDCSRHESTRPSFEDALGQCANCASCHVRSGLVRCGSCQRRQ